MFIIEYEATGLFCDRLPHQKAPGEGLYSQKEVASVEEGLEFIRRLFAQYQTEKHQPPRVAIRSFVWKPVISSDR